MRITSSHVSTSGASYPLAELTEVRRDGPLRTLRAWGYWFGRVVAVLALLALLPAIVVAIVLLVRADSLGIDAILYILGGAYAIFEFVTDYGLEGWGKGDYGTLTIRARWRDEEVVLVRSTALVTFGRTYRSLECAGVTLPLRVNARGLAGAEVTRDGTAVLVRRAHPAFGGGGPPPTGWGPAERGRSW